MARTIKLSTRTLRRVAHAFVWHEPFTMAAIRVRPSDKSPGWHIQIASSGSRTGWAWRMQDCTITRGEGLTFLNVFRMNEWDRSRKTNLVGYLDLVNFVLDELGCPHIDENNDLPFVKDERHGGSILLSALGLAAAREAKGIRFSQLQE